MENFITLQSSEGSGGKPHGFYAVLLILEGMDDVGTNFKLSFISCCGNGVVTNTHMGGKAL
jgi:hypothetical protein